MSSGSKKPSFDTSAAAAAERRYRFSQIHRKFQEERCKLKAMINESKKRLPDVIKKLRPSPINPEQDCFAMTLEVGSSSKRSKKKALTEPKIAADDEPQCLDIKSELFIEESKAGEALEFYKTAFGAETLRSYKDAKRKADQVVPFTLAYDLKIGSNIILLSLLNDELSPSSTLRRKLFFSLLTDDIDSAVEKAVKAGATLSGKVVQVYSYCQIWGSMVKVNDPYGNVWIIYNKLCLSCLQSLGLLA